MQRAKTIDELYEEVKGYDLVLCNDAPLATALNNRVDVPRLDALAVTPRQLAAQMSMDITGSSIISDISLVKHVADDTGYQLRYVHGEIQNIQRIRRYTPDVGKHLGYRSRKVLSSYSYYNTLDRVMSMIEGWNPEYLEGKRIAVIGVDLFDDLDKHMIPADYDEIDMFTYTEDYSVPELRLLGNNRQIAECAYDIIRRTDPNDVAIVMDSAGTIADALRSAMYRNRIPFINSLNVRDLNSIRDYLEFCSTSLRFDTLKVKEVRQLICGYGGMISHRYDSYNLDVLYDSGFFDETKRTGALVGCMSRIGGMTFSEVSEACVPSGKDRGNIGLLLRDMECADEKVSEDVLDDLLYAVNNISNLNHNEQIPAEEKEGVVLIDCKNSVYVDRPVVIYAGLGKEWDTDMKNLDFLTSGQKDDVEERNKLRFDVLMQQGTARFYLANSTKGGKEAQPCSLFDDVDGRKAEHFSDVCPNVIRDPWEIEQVDRSQEFRTERLESDPYVPKHFSPSKYSSFVSCPRMYMLSSLVSDAESDTTVTGNKIHEYAEFRVSYPEKAAELGTERCAEMIAERCAALQSKELADVERTMIRSAVLLIDALITRLGVQPGELTPRAKDKEPNMFLEHFGLEGTSEFSEAKLMSSDPGMEGIMDLVAGTSIYDYKTGKIKDYNTLRKSISFDRTDYPKDFQALFYLCLLQDSGHPVGDFNLFFVQDGLNSQIKDGAVDLKPCYRSFYTARSRRTVISELAPGFPKEDCYQGIDIEEVLDVLFACSPDPEQWYTPENVAAVARCPSVGRKKADGIVKKVAKLLSGYVVKLDDCIAVPDETLVDFRVRVQKDLEENGLYYNSDYPAVPTFDCKHCYYKDMCTSQVISGGETDGDE